MSPSTSPAGARGGGGMLRRSPPAQCIMASVGTPLGLSPFALIREFQQFAPSSGSAGGGSDSGGGGGSSPFAMMREFEDGMSHAARLGML